MPRRANIPHLTHLDVSGNELETLPSELTFPILEELDLGFVDMKSMPDWFYELPSIKKLTMKFAPIEVQEQLTVAYPDLYLDCWDDRAVRRQYAKIYQDPGTVYKKLELASNQLLKGDISKALKSYRSGLKLVKDLHPFIQWHMKFGEISCADLTQEDEASRTFRLAEQYLDELLPFGSEHYTYPVALYREIVKTCCVILMNETCKGVSSVADTRREQALFWAEVAMSQLNYELPNMPLIKGLPVTKSTLYAAIVNLNLKCGQDEQAFAIADQAINENPKDKELAFIKRNKGYKTWLNHQ